MRASLALLALVGCQASPPMSPPAPAAGAHARGAPAASRGAPVAPPTPTRPTPTPTPPPPAGDFEHDMMVRYHMHGGLDLLRAIERLLLRGKLDDARALAREISDAPIDPDLGAWAARAALVRERATALAAAPGVDEACRREARLAEACAQCHIDTRVQPEFRTPPPLPPDLDTIPARMARHRWAADRIWEGLVGGDDAPWQAGLAVLAAAPLRWPELGERKGLARVLQQLADQARQRGATESLGERARGYGEMLVICAACHAAK